MDYMDAIRRIMELRGYTQVELAKELDVSQAAVAQNIRRDPKLSTMLSYLRPMGYRCAFVPEGTRLPEGSIIVDGPHDGSAT